MFLTLAGFAFKVSAVPFHFWAPDTYEGAPTPVTAFLSVASKAGGFVALISIVKFGFFPSEDSWQPIIWVLAAASMTLGNLAALRQTNIVRMLAYSSIAQGGFMLVPIAVAADVGDNGNSAWSGGRRLPRDLRGDEPRCVRRGDRGGAPDRFGRDLELRRARAARTPVLAVFMSLFLFSLAGIPPLAGWYAKLVMFRSVFDSGTTGAVILGVIAALNAVVAFFYYAGVTRAMWFRRAGAGTEERTLATPLALERRDGHDHHRRHRRRRVPARRRPPRRARLPHRVTILEIRPVGSKSQMRDAGCR